MPKFLTEKQVKQYREEGFISPVSVMGETEALGLREQIESFEAAQGKQISWKENRY